MVKIIKLRDQTFPNQRLAKLKLGLNYGKDLATADVTLHCGTTGRSFKAHKIVLAAISDRLRDYLVQHEREGDGCCCFNPNVISTGKGTPSDEGGVHFIIEHMDWEVLKIIIDFAYSGETRVAASIVDRVCEAAHRLQIKYLRDSFVKMDRKEYEEMKAGRKRNVARSASATSIGYKGSTVISQGKQIDVVIGRKRNAEENLNEMGNSSAKIIRVAPMKKERPARQLARGSQLAGLSSDTESAESEGEERGRKGLTGQTKDSNIATKHPEQACRTITSKQDGPHIVRIKDGIKLQNVPRETSRALGGAGQVKQVARISSLKPILPATSTTTTSFKSESTLVKPSSSNVQQVRKVILPAAGTRMVVPQPRVTTNAQMLSPGRGSTYTTPVGNIVRLVTSPTSPKILPSSSQPLIMETMRRADGTLIQVLKPQVMLPSKLGINSTLAPAIQSGNVVQLGKRGTQSLASKFPITSTIQQVQIKKLSLPKGVQIAPKKKIVSPQIIPLPVKPVSNSIIVSPHLSVNSHRKIAPLLPLKSDLPIGTNISTIKTSSAPTILKVNNTHPAVTAVAGSSSVFNRNSESTEARELAGKIISIGGNPQVIRQGSQSRVVIQSPLSTVVSPQHQQSQNVSLVTAKTRGGTPSVSSLKPGIPATLPDDFLDTEDSDSEKSQPAPSSTSAGFVAKDKKQFLEVSSTSSASPAKLCILSSTEQVALGVRSSGRAKKVNQKYVVGVENTTLSTSTGETKGTSSNKANNRNLNTKTDSGVEGNSLTIISKSHAERGRPSRLHKKDSQVSNDSRTNKSKETDMKRASSKNNSQSNNKMANVKEDKSSKIANKMQTKIQEPIAASLSDEEIAAMIYAPRSSRSSAKSPAPKTKSTDKSSVRSASEKGEISRKSQVSEGRGTRAGANESHEHKNNEKVNPRLTRSNALTKKVDKKASLRGRARTK